MLAASHYALLLSDRRKFFDNAIFVNPAPAEKPVAMRPSAVFLRKMDRTNASVFHRFTAVKDALLHMPVTKGKA